MNSTPKISVVTPVYNGEDHLIDCIESVLSQDYTNFEYLILDNASTDKTAHIVEAFAARDSRIRLARNETLLPLFDNWNESLRLISADSDYCKVVHADDFLLSGALRQFAECAVLHPEATLIGSYRIDGAGVGMDSIPYPISLVNGKELGKGWLLKRGFRDQFGSPTSVMYRSDCIHNVEEFYDPSNEHADTQACFDLLARGDYGFVHQVLTYTRRHEGALTPNARIMDTHALGLLKILCRKGPMFLNEHEMKMALKRRLRLHYRRLARDLKLVRNPAFREFHLRGLKALGLRFNPLRFAYAAFIEYAQKLVILLGRLG